MDGIIPPQLAYFPGRVIAEVWAYTQQLVGTDHAKVACSLGIEGVAYIFPKPEDTGTQRREVGGSRVVEM
jgi:hypothetical protein